MRVNPSVSTTAGLAAGLAVFVATVTGLGAQQQPAHTTCTLTGRITAAGIPLPGVSLTARRGDTVHRATSTAVDGTYRAELDEGEYSLNVELTGFQPVERTIALGGAPCVQSLDLTLALTPRTAPSAGLRSGGPGVTGGRAAQFQTLAVNADAAAAAVDSAETVEAAPLLLPPGFNAEASADAIVVTGNAARVDGGLLDERAEAFARGELPPNIADLAAAIAANGLPAGGPGGPAGGRGGPDGPGRRGGDGGFALGGRGGRGGRRLQASANYSFGGSALDSSPYQLRGDAPREKLPYTRHSFGTTFGGPLRIPGIYRNTANRSSFQASYTANRGSNLFDQYATVPTDAMRNGDFSFVPAPLIDPATGLPFEGNRIPAGRLSPSAQALLALIPAANLPGTTRNLHYTTTTASVSDAINARVNHTFGSAPAAGRGGRGGGGGGGRGAAGRASLPRATTVSLNAQFQYRRSDNDQTNVFSTLGGRNTSTSVSAPVGVNIARGRDIQTINLQLSRSSSRTSNRFAGIDDVAGRAGIQGTSTDSLAWGVPALSFSSVSGLRDVTPSRRDDSRIGLNYSWTHPLGRHSLRVGSGLQRDRNSSLAEANANGSFVFTGAYTSGGTAVAPGFDVADFLLGMPQQATVQYGPGTVVLHGRSFNAFVQDDWRARGNLTVNLGLRYELLRPFVEEGGRLVNLDVTPDFSAAVPVTAGDTGPFSGSFPSALLRTDVNNLAPRLGIAWRAPQGLVVRGGYGVSYNSGAYAGFARQLSSQPPFAVTNTQIGALNSILLMENALLGGLPTETTNTFGVDKDYALGRVQTWNASAQRNLGRSWMVSAGYTHTRGSSLDVVRAPNRDAEGLRIDGVQPFLWQSSEGSSVLNSANFQLQRRQVRGIGWRVTYALARSRDNAPSIGGGTVVAQNDQDIDAEWGLSNFDRRHRLSADVNADLPFGANRRWLNNGGPWAALLEDWRLNATFTADSGTPLSARIRGAASDVSRGLNGALRADYSGADLSVDDPSIDQFFDTSAFTLPAAGLFGNSPRNVIIGPGSRQLDAALSRDVRLGGNRAVSIQIRATNLLNLVNYTAIDTFVNSPTFGQVTSVRPMRSAQLNLRFRF